MSREPVSQHQVLEEHQTARGSDAVHIREASQINDGNVIEAENKSIIPQ